MAQGLYDIQPLETFIQQGFTILTPNTRLARRIKTEWDAKCSAAGAKVWQPLPVHPLEAWLLRQWQLAVTREWLPQQTVLELPQVLELWRQVINEQARHSADYQLVRTEAIAEMAQQARESLLRWQVAYRAPDVQQLFFFERDCNAFLQWLRAFDERLAAARLCTPTDCLVQLAGLPHAVPESRTVLLEFDQLAPLLRSALMVVSPEWQEHRTVQAPADCHAHVFNSKRQELQAVASWVASESRSNPAQNIGVVLDRNDCERVTLEYLLRREFECLGENYASLPVNFSLGTPLLHAPLVRTALDALSTALTHTTVPGLQTLLHSRFLGACALHTSDARLLGRLYTLGRESVAVAEVCRLGERDNRSESGSTLAQRLRATARIAGVRRRVLPSAWTERFADILALWGWPGEQALDSVEYQQLQQWWQLLDGFAAFDAICGPVDFAQALTLLRDNCRRQIFHPQTDDFPIHVLGPLEASGLSFDQLWVCGMQATSWPSPPRPNPFIPLTVQQRCNMPHASYEGEYAFSAALVEHYAHNCGKLHASYCRELDGVPDLPSPLLAGFTTQVAAAQEGITAHWNALYDRTELACVSDTYGPPLQRDGDNRLTGGSNVLEDQSQCAFRAFARHRLQVRPTPGFVTALSASDRGSLLHAALAALWRCLGDSATLAALDATTEQQVVDEAVAVAIQHIPVVRQRALGNAFWSLERQRLATVLREWLTVERQRTPFTVSAIEQDMELTLDRLQLHLRLDRVDLLPDGSHVVIDYKSGECSVRDWLGERPPSPQLPLYAQSGTGPLAALAFALVVPRHCRYTGIGRAIAGPGFSTDMPLPTHPASEVQDWIALQQQWRDVIARLATEFVHGNARVDPYRSDLCARCGLQSLCRVESEVLADEVEEA